MYIALKMREKFKEKDLKTANIRHLMIINELSQNFKKVQNSIHYEQRVSNFHQKFKKLRIAFDSLIFSKINICI